ncbi:MAG TPA: hypothetical protein VK158_06065, partial [Acidobacteriota bacterium]|nr:hypothetical protein [Acidobacteriota bacterium]
MTSRNEYKDTLEVQFSPPESDRSNLIITINNEQIVAPLLKKFSPFAHIYDFLQSVRKGKETKLQIPGGNSMFTIDAEAGSKKLKITAA